MCRQCGSLLTSHDLVCPSCKASRYGGAKMSDFSFDVTTGDRLRDFVDIKSPKISRTVKVASVSSQSHRSKSYGSTAQESSMKKVGFIIGLCVPFIFSLFIWFISCHLSTKLNGQGQKYKSDPRGELFVKSMLRGGIVQIGLFVGIPMLIELITNLV